MNDKEKIAEVLRKLEQLEHWEDTGMIDSTLPNWIFGSLGALPKTQERVYKAHLNRIRHILEDEKK